MSALGSHLGIRGRLIILALGVALGALTVLTLIQAHVTRQALVEREARLLVSAAKLAANTIDDFIGENLDNVRSDAHAPSLARFLWRSPEAREKSEDKEELSALLERGTRRDSIFVESYGLLDLAGRDVADSNAQNVGKDEAATDYFRDALKDGLPHVSDLEALAPGSRRLVLTFSSVVRDSELHPIGVLRLKFYAQILQRVIARDTALLGSGAFLVLVDHEGRYIAHGLDAHAVGRNVARDSPELARGLSDLVRTPMFTTHLDLSSHGGGREQKVAGTKIQRQEWQVAVVRPSAAFMAPVTEQLESAGLVALGVAAVAILAAVFFGTRVAAPILRLTESAERVARGDMEAQAKISGPREVQALARAFNLMTGQVRETLEGLLVEIGDRTRAEGAARESEERVRAFVENALDVILVLDGSGVVLYASPSIERLLGRALPDVIGKNWFDWVAPEDLAPARAKLEQAVRENRPVRAQLRFLHENGEPRDVEVVGRPAFDVRGVGGVLVNARDVSDRVRAESERAELEERLTQARKMEAIGHLAGGVAHDFNNLLTPIIGYTELVRASVPHSDRIYKDLAVVLEAADGARQLVRQLLAFGRKQALEIRVLDLGEQVRRIEKILRAMIPESIDVVWDLPAEAVLIRADPTQLQQVMLNLAVNAADAMSGTAGRLVVSVARRTLLERDAELELERGAYGVLTVTDSGHGMDQQTRERLFEPFFTTKERGKGTGLGLATVYGIVMQHRGAIAVSSQKGRGTTFEVYFPCTSAIEPKKPDSVLPVSSPGQGETVLVAEDDPSVRMLVKNVLERNGYRVLVAENGLEALALARAEPGPIDLLLSDVIMPGMNGRALRDAIRATFPNLRVLFMSGYTGDVLSDLGELDPTVSLVSKPFTPDILLESVRRALGRDAARGASNF
ncbi:MAG TPA: ATP-binding protein [Polyangiaceae bacterium]|jgi:PAS domain S-box-containing protein|nr:ATP-binding protein [Polyangiaceae bacterium]